MRKAKLRKVAQANAHEIEPPMPALSPRGKRTKFSRMTAGGAVAAVKKAGAKKKGAVRV
jgi:hypothetical protein